MADENTINNIYANFLGEPGNRKFYIYNWSLYIHYNINKFIYCLYYNSLKKYI